ncbi:Aldehyde/histidinol dehydrogenase [Flagelloscypha sp. PMI_526]|nr:Aldehyde/histidinol dehydrogenase [Flagelloscypha sp. PMI_526]
MSNDTLKIAQAAKVAFEASQLVHVDERIKALRAIKAELTLNKDAIFAANSEDVLAAQEEVKAGRMSESLMNRLDLRKPGKWESMLQGIDDVASLPDPTGSISYTSELDDQLELYRVSCPIGVLLIIFEARPEVVVNIATLAIKSGNTAILKGGKESTRTAILLAKAISSGLAQTSLPSTYIQVIQTRAEVSALLSLDQFIDLVIPRGSNSLVRNIQNNTRIPVMGHADGLCLAYLDEFADLKKAIDLVLESKIDYPSACNSLETLIVHEKVVNSIWPEIAKSLLDANVVLHCDPTTLAAAQALQPTPSNKLTHIKASTEESYTTEFLSLDLAVVTLPGLPEAIKWINSHGSHHTDLIITESDENAAMFCRGVDSAGTYVNASTRFADGFRYGFGTEVGISTGRIHARGPVGLEGLVTYKYVLRGKGTSSHLVSTFGSGAGKKQFKHRPISNLSKDAPFH